MGRYRENQCRLVCVCLAVAGFVLLSAATKGANNIWLAMGQGIISLVLLFLSFVAWDISSMSPADSHSILSLCMQYVIYRAMLIVGRQNFHKLDRICRSLPDSQETLLREILQQNAGSVYGKFYQFEGISTRNEFRHRHPLTDYAHFEPYIKRIEVGGEQNVLCTDPVIFLATTSGTTGKNKSIPVTHHMKGKTARKIGPLMYYMMDKKAGLTLERVFVLAHKCVKTLTASGIPRAPVSSHMNRNLPFYIAPPEAFDITNEQVAHYVHAVFSLREREVGHIEALVSTLLFGFWVYVERNWQRICDAIELGQISPDNTADAKLAKRLSSYLPADHTRATELRIIFKGYRGAEMIGVASKIWPTLKFARTLVTGGFAHHARILRKTYMKNIIQISPAHVASEGFMGFNMSSNPLDFTYTALVDYGFMEFIPEAQVEDEQPETMLAEEVRIGQKYEIVLTTPMGLYRYRTGDIVQICDTRGQSPIYHFLYRRGQLLNLYWEKTPENVFYQAVEKTLDNFDTDITLTDFTSTENVLLDSVTGEVSEIRHYVLFIEVNIMGSSYILSEEECFMFDHRLCELMELYSDLRHSGSISCMKVVQLQSGTFQRLKSRIIADTQNQQYKVPRVLRNPTLLQFLWSQQLTNIQTINY